MGSVEDPDPDPVGSSTFLDDPDPDGIRKYKDPDPNFALTI